MSYDLSIFRAARELSSEEAAEVHAELCVPTSPRLALEAERDLATVYQRITRKFPELDDDEDDSPFNAKLDRTAYGLVLPIAFSRADEVKDALLALARPLRFAVFDPQTNTLHRPTDALPAAKDPRIPPKTGERELVAGLAPRLRSHGFELVTKPKGMSFRRTLPGGLVQMYVLMRANSKELKAYFRIEEPALGERIAAYLGGSKPVPLVWTSMISPFRERDGKITESTRVPDEEYAVCHASCLARARVDAANAFEEFAVPYFEKMSTREAIDEAYNGDPGSALPGYLHQLRLAVPREPPMFAVVGLALAHAVHRPDFAACLDRYRTRVSTWGAGESLDLYEAFVKALLQDSSSSSS